MPDLTYKTYRGAREFYVSALEGAREVGFVDASRLVNPSPCDEDLRAIEARLGSTVLGAYVVHKSELIDTRYLRKGVGVVLYALAARAAAKRFCALLPQTCDGGFTSDAARRVWNSRRLAEHVLRSGQAIYWVGK